MIRVNQTLCVGCGVCIDECPNGAISLSGDVVTVSSALCDDCGACVEVCPNGALSRPSGALSRPSGALSRSDEAPTWTIEPLPVDGQSVEIVPAGTGRLTPRRRTVLPAVVGALTWVGSEVVPRLAPLALNALDGVLDRRSGVQRQSKDTTLAPVGRRGQRRRRRRRGRRSQ
jgi:NAD-dependent dihydropyrimidine dehydrogenase PreA subunit